jgi:large subunit ribosomal protein L15e
VYRYLREAWKKPKENYIGNLMRERVISWRRQPTIVRIENPTRLERARELGYKAKKGFVIVRIKIRRGGRRKIPPSAGRRQKRMGITRFTPAKSLKLIAEERSGRKYPNLEVLNSYYVWEDGRHKWFEVILVDTHNPSVKSDPSTLGMGKSKRSED